MGENAINLYEDAVLVLAKHGKTIDDIRAVVTDKLVLDKKKFFEAAKLTNYDSAYPVDGFYIPVDLKLVGENFWLERATNWPNEWWEFKTMPSLNGKIGCDRIAVDQWGFLLIDWKEENK